MTADDAEVRPFVYVCNSENGVYFSWTLCIIEGIILVFGAFLAWETRREGRSGAVDRASDFGPRGPWFDSPPVHISLWH